jgi:hypothetical protein
MVWGFLSIPLAREFAGGSVARSRTVPGSGLSKSAYNSRSYCDAAAGVTCMVMNPFPAGK